MDVLTPSQRSRNMSAIRSRGNRTTEKAVRFRLVRAGIRGWELHSSALPGRPDFIFQQKRLAVFIDGCYWHGCPKCYRAPTTNVSYWSQKLIRNVSRDRAITGALRKDGWRAVRFWEHQSKKNAANLVRKIRELVISTKGILKSAASRTVVNAKLEHRRGQRTTRSVERPPSSSYWTATRAQNPKGIAA